MIFFLADYILSGITAKDYETTAFTLTCSEETLKSGTLKKRIRHLLLEYVYRLD